MNRFHGFSALVILITLGCGGANEPSKGQTQPTDGTATAAKDGAPTTEPSGPAPSSNTSSSSSAAAPSLATNAVPIPPSASTAPPAGNSLTKAQFIEAQKIVMASDPGPFDTTYKSVVAKLGEPNKKGDNMFEWLTMDAGKCTSFFMTKDAQKGHAAAGFRGDADAEFCK